MESYTEHDILDGGDGDRIQLDTTVKRLLSVRYILANIMVHAIVEYRGCTIEEAMALIDGDPVVSRKDLRSGREMPEIVRTASNESGSSERGRIYYDIVFYAHTPQGEHQRVWINVEGQKSYYPGYDLVTRGVFYSARLLSDQLGKEFDPRDYDDIKKAYSIWICMNPPRRDRHHRRVENTIMEYRMTPSLLYAGEETDIANVHTGRYDLMTTIMVYLSPDGRSENELVGMLSTLFCANSTADERIRVLSEDYGFPMTREIETEVNAMCNYSEMIYERGVADAQAAMQAAIANKDAALANMQAAIANKDAEIARLRALSGLTGNN